MSCKFKIRKYILSFSLKLSYENRWVKFINFIFIVQQKNSTLQKYPHVVESYTYVPKIPAIIFLLPMIFLNNFGMYSNQNHQNMFQHHI